jgi:hypothetical protein
MPRKETLYERPLRRPLDEPTRRAIESEYRRRRHEIPIPTELRWHSTDPRFTIHSSMLSFVVHFTQDDRLLVDVELSMAARMLATVANRRQAVQFIESIAVGLGL